MSLVDIVPVNEKHFDDWQETFDINPDYARPHAKLYQVSVLSKENVKSVFTECTKDFYVLCLSYKCQC